MKIITDYIDEYKGLLCQCGKRKETKMTVCPNCFYRLPVNLRKNLYLGFGDGYKEAYDAAVEYLNK